MPRLTNKKLAARKVEVAVKKAKKRPTSAGKVACQHRTVSGRSGRVQCDDCGEPYQPDAAVTRAFNRATSV